MYCKICGQDGPDNSSSCPYCGAKLNLENNISEIEEDPVLEIEYNPYSENRKSFLRKPLLLCLICIALMGIIIVLFCNPGFRSTTVRFFSSPSGLMEHVYSKCIQNIISSAHTVDEWSVGNTVAAEYQMDIALGTDVLSLLAASLEAETEDINGLSNIHIHCDAAYQKNFLRADYNFSLNEHDIIAMEQYVDTLKMQQFLYFPELSDTLLVVDMDESTSISNVFDSNMQPLVQIAPELLQEISIQYTNMLIDGFENTNRSRMTISNHGISQRVTVLKSVISSKRLYQTQIDILEDMAINPTLANILLDMEEQTGQAYYDDFQINLNQEISTLEHMIRGEQSYGDYTLYTYLDRYNNIIGIKLEYCENGAVHTVISYITVTNQKQLATELLLWDNLIITGVGIMDERFHGTFSLYQSNQLLGEIIFEDFSYSSSEISGVIKILPEQEIVEHLMDEAGYYQAYLDAGRLQNLVVEMIPNWHADHKEISICFYTDKKLLASISTSIVTKDMTPTESMQGIPYINDYTDADSWRSCIDEDALNSLIERLINAGVRIEVLTEDHITEKCN